MAPPRKSELLSLEVALDPTVELRSEHENPYVLRRLCELADEKMISGEHDCLRVARHCCRIGHRLQTNEARARSFGRLASALRLVGRLAHSKRALEIALENAPDHLRGDLLRRRCYRRLYEERLPVALTDARASVALSSGADHARALGALGIVLGYSGRIPEAIRAHEQCLAETDPDAAIEYCNAIQNYATSLAQGTREEMKQALKLCAKARKMLTRRHRMQRAKLWWTEGLLHFRLGHLGRAWRALDTSRRSLIGLEAAPEVAAVVADMARVSQKPTAIRQICHEAAAVLSGREPLQRPLRALARAARGVIPEAAAALRQEACTLAPCLAL